MLTGYSGRLQKGCPIEREQWLLSFTKFLAHRNAGSLLPYIMEYFERKPEISYICRKPIVVNVDSIFTDKLSPLSFILLTKSN